MYTYKYKYKIYTYKSSVLHVFYNKLMYYDNVSIISSIHRYIKDSDSKLFNDIIVTYTLNNSEF